MRGRSLLFGSILAAAATAGLVVPFPPAPAAAAETLAAHDAPMVVRGFSMQLNDPHGSPAYKQAIDQMAAMGCNWINFVVAARQDDIHADTIRSDWDAMPNMKELESILKYAHPKNIHTMLMPIVLLDKAGAKEWRGVIAPPDWDRWFDSYTLYITQMAQLAKREKTDIFCVGSELLSTESFHDRWLHVIGEIKKIYKGKLTYSANWDHFDRENPRQTGGPTFWDSLDIIGMNNYNELAKEPGESVSQIVRAWAPIKKTVLAFGRKKHMPVMFTEVGWHNLQNTLSEPWNYVATGPIDPDEQLHAFQAFFDAWKDVPRNEFLGAFIWEWRPGAQPTDHGSYSLQGEPAMKVVKQWIQEGRQNGR